MRSYTGKKLTEFLANKKFQHFKKRFCFSELESFLNSDIDNRVGILFGIRRTGKTTMLLQAMQNRNPSECLYINCSKKDKMEQVYEAIEKHSACKYIFIDEITKIEDFIDDSADLADLYAGTNRKIVLSGTDSLAFHIAKGNELLDRTVMFHTTRIPYHEYAYLLEKDIFSYMKYGGTLSDENIFYNSDSLDEYTNSAIVKNILHTLRFWDMGKNNIPLPIKEEDMLSFVNRLLQRDSQKFIVETLKETFKSYDLGSAKQMLRSRGRRARLLGEETVPAAPLEMEELRVKIMENLNIKEAGEHKLDEEEGLKLLIKYLVRLDVLEPAGKDRFRFVQPGMRYCQIDAILSAIEEKLSEVYNPADIELVCSKIRQDVEGRLLEEIAFMDLQKQIQGSDIEIFKYRNADAKEFDIVLVNREAEQAAVYEVKRTKSAAIEQAKNLLDDDFRSEFTADTGCTIVNSAVLYGGEDLTLQGIDYKNLSDFLTEFSSSDILQQLLDQSQEILHKKE